MRANGVASGLMVGLPIGIFLWYLIYLVLSMLWGV